jgi:Mn2+/Fe2+ NRAMP family transporter
MTEIPATSNDLAGWRRGVDRAFVYLVTLFFVGVLLQVFLAGVGAFGDHSAKIENASSFDPHRALGNILGAVALILLILAVLARASRATWIGALILTVLAAGAQSGLAAGGEDNKWVGGLHALDGIIILLLAGWLTGMAHRREAARRKAG